MRKIVLIQLLVSLLVLLFTLPANAQHFRNRNAKKDTIKAKKVSIYDVDTMINIMPRQRMFFQDKIDKQQRQATASNGDDHNAIYFSEDTTLNAILTKAILKDIDHLQIMIENMPANGRDAQLDNQTKIRYLTAVNGLLQDYNNDIKVDPYYYKKLVANMHDMLIAANENKLMDFAKANANIYSIANGKIMFEGHMDVRAYVYVTVGKQDPRKMIRRLAEYADDPFADDIIIDASRIVPGELFDYISSTNYPTRNAVRRSRDPLVQTIVKIADHSRAPLRALPFLGEIYYGRKSLVEVDALAANEDVYYKELVKLKLQNDSIARDVYTSELAYRGLRYVREMDDLHESPDNVRFKSIDGLSPEALYFILVYGQDEIYTSSFLGTFKRLMERMAPTKGDELLDSVHYDHFRTFLRMCAGYNTLSTFLGTIDEANRIVLMSNFIGGLEKGKEDDLEDAVDVADAFGSIKDSALSEFLQNKVKENYELSYRVRSKKGVVIYGLLARLFEGSKTNGNDAGAADESQKLGLAPINLVPFNNLVDDSGVVYEQIFFYGDEDGAAAYASFLANFKEGKWKITYEKYWTVISSTEGKKVVIYGNLPLEEPNDEDAQNRLTKFLNDKDIHPTIMIHRGHSYHLPLTLAKLTKQVKIVILGSCGGYHNLSIVLDHSPDAHIVSSKQTGSGSVNEPILRALETRLVDGKDINWIEMWSELDAYFSKKPDLIDKFSDYVPPYKNLGAIFIKAYRKMINAEPGQ